MRPNTIIDVTNVLERDGYIVEEVTTSEERSYFDNPVTHVDIKCRSAIRGYAPNGNPYYKGFRGAYKNIASVPAIKNVIFNEPVTVVLWADDTKTIVRAQNGEPFDPEKGLAMAITKKALGNQGNYYETIKKWVEKYESENCTVEFVNDLGERIASAFSKIGEIKIPTITPKFDPNTPVPKIKFDTDVNLIGKVQIPGLDIESYHSQIDEFISGIIKERNDAIDGEFHRRLAEAGLKVEPINGPEFTDLREANPLINHADETLKSMRDIIFNAGIDFSTVKFVKNPEVTSLRKEGSE